MRDTITNLLLITFITITLKLLPSIKARKEVLHNEIETMVGMNLPHSDEKYINSLIFENFSNSQLLLQKFLKKRCVSYFVHG